MVLAQDLDKAFIEHNWDALTAVVPAQQNLQQIRGMFDQFRCNFKYMSKDEFFGGVFPQRAGCMAHLSAIQDIQISPIQGGQNPITERRKDITEAEGKFATGLQQIVG
jgi:hypothetical protein